MNGRFVALGLYVGLCVLATVVGCSAGETEDQDPPPPPVNGEDLSGAQLCEMVPQKFVQDRLGTPITDSRPWDRDKKPVPIASCRYDMADTPDAEAGVEVAIWPGNGTAEERARWRFAGPTGKGKYEEVDGLGDAAAFGSGLPDVHTLAVVTAHEDAFRSIEVSVAGPKPPTLEQLRPIAERVLQKLDG